MAGAATSHAKNSNNVNGAHRSVEASPAVAYWRRTFNGLTGYIACFSGARDGKKLERPATKFFPYPHAVENAAAWLHSEAAAVREAYAAANLFTDNRKRDKRFATEVATLWTDGDGALIPAGFPQPTITVETSPGRWNYLWVLTRPIAPDQAEELNRRIAYAIGADAGGWDIGQLLRVPGLPNFKYPDAPIVTVTDDSGPMHDPDELAAALPPAPAEAARARRTPPTGGDGATPTPGDEPPIRGMNAELWQGKWLTTADDEGPVSDDPLVFNTGTTDRSRVLWHIACDAEEHGASEALIAWIFEDRDRALGFHKFCDRSDMYRQQARKVIERERAPRATVTIGRRTEMGDSSVTPTPCADQVAAMQARIDQLEAHNAALQQALETAQERFHASLALDRNGAIKAQRTVAKAVFAELASATGTRRTDADGWVKTWLPGIAENAGISTDRASVHIATMARDELIEKRVTHEKHVDQATGEMTLRPRVSLRLVSTPDELLTRLSTWQPSPPRAKAGQRAGGAWGGARESGTVRCDHHPGAALICAVCGETVQPGEPPTGGREPQDEGHGDDATGKKRSSTYHLQDEGHRDDPTDGARVAPVTRKWKLTGTNPAAAFTPMGRRRWREVPDYYNECAVCGGPTTAKRSVCQPCAVRQGLEDAS